MGEKFNNSNVGKCWDFLAVLEALVGRLLEAMQNLGVTLSTDNAIARNATISNYEFPVLMQNAFF